MKPVRVRRGALAALLALVGCSSGARAPGPNLFLVVLDAASAAYFSPYGAPRSETPHIDRLAADSVVFANAYAQAPATVTSTASLLTGVRPMTHRMTPQTRLDDSLAVLPELLRRAGYRTHGVVGNPNAGLPAFGFDRGYDVFVEVYAPAGDGPDYRVATPEAIHAALLPLLGSASASGNFFHVHYLYPHTPYDAPRRFDDADDPPRLAWNELRELLEAYLDGAQLSAADVAALERAYRANVRYADEGVGVLLDALRAAGLYDDALIVLAADHGEAFGGHGFIGHNKTLYDDVTRIPLLIKFPRADGVAPGRVSVLAETVDVAPTLLEYVGTPVPGHFEGESLLGAARGERDAPAGSEVVLATTYRVWQAIRSGPHKLIVGRGWAPQLYDLERDPSEREDLARSRPGLLRRLRGRLVEINSRSAGPAAAPRRPSDDPALGRLLEELGYVDREPRAP